LARNISNSGNPAQASVAEAFSALGGVFLASPEQLSERLEAARGLIFDWDGVFNAGVKGEGAHSTFCEADSMGVNLLRYAFWRRDAELAPCAIITGEDNSSARRYAVREHFDAVCEGVKDKGAAVQELCAAWGLDCGQLVCVFDDANDLGMARRCGLRVLVRRRASPLLQRFVTERELGDYVTASEAGRQAVREAAELLLGLMGSADAVLRSRMAFDESYTRYFAARQAVRTELKGDGAPSAPTSAVRSSAVSPSGER
jgi:3-deoxy-D-manno-octulosonate 8-phosphate phosphatase (KDO 8-P phosphatase)